MGNGELTLSKNKNDRSLQILLATGGTSVFRCQVEEWWRE